MTIVYILLAILILELLIFLHELGHFTAGKLLGFRILGFSLGFGPALFKFKKGETEYSLRAFPVGGLCQFDGEDEEALENDPRRFNAQPVWKRFIVILAGPFMNILTAFLIAFVFYLCKPMPVYAVDPVTHYEVPIVASVKENSPAEKAGLKNGDVIIAINGQYPTETADTDIYSSVSALIGVAGNDFVMTVERSGAQLDLAVSDAFNSTENRTVTPVEE